MVKNKNVGKPRNYALESGVYRFGKGTMYHKKAIYKFTKKVNKKVVPAKTAVFVEKKVGGAKNGGTRMVGSKNWPITFPLLMLLPLEPPRTSSLAMPGSLEPRSLLEQSPSFLLVYT